MLTGRVTDFPPVKGKRSLCSQDRGFFSFSFTLQNDSLSSCEVLYFPSLLHGVYIIGGKVSNRQ